MSGWNLVFLMLGAELGLLALAHVRSRQRRQAALGPGGATVLELPARPVVPPLPVPAPRAPVQLQAVAVAVPQLAPALPAPVSPAPQAKSRRDWSGAARWVVPIVQWTALGIACGLLLLLFGPYVIGGRSFTVMSGSMTPTIRTGDVVVTSRISPGDAKIGDVITFRDPDGGSKLITHRVRRIRIGGSTVSFVTKGDAANAVQRWAVPSSGSIGLVRYRVPKLGYLVVWTRTLPGRLLLIVIPALILGAAELRRLWRPKKASDAPA